MCMHIYAYIYVEREYKSFTKQGFCCFCSTEPHECEVSSLLWSHRHALQNNLKTKFFNSAGTATENNEHEM